jgi:hypothetical protein
MPRTTAYSPTSTTKRIPTGTTTLWMSSSAHYTNVTATNNGQWRGSFHVLVTGSNGYNKAAAPVAPTGYSLQSLPAAVNAPIFDSQGQGRFIQPVYLSSYSPSLCAAACDKQTQYDKSTASDNCNYKSCVYANLYYLIKDGVPQTVVCALYTEATDPSYAVNKVCFRRSI